MMRLKLVEDIDILEEAKKHNKKKKKSQTQNNPVFKSVDDLKKWVKKRQKGMSPWGMFNTNAGNVPVSNAIFNGSFSSDGGSGAGISDGGISNGGLSAPAGDGGGMAMGEAFKISNYNLSKIVKQFIEKHIDLIDLEDWDTLIDDYAMNPDSEDFLYDEDYIRELIYVLGDALYDDPEFLDVEAILGGL